MVSVVRHQTDEGFRVGLFDEGSNRILYVGSTTTRKLPASEGRYMRVLREANRSDVAKVRRSVKRFNGGSLRGLPDTVKKLIA